VKIAHGAASWPSRRGGGPLALLLLLLAAAALLGCASKTRTVPAALDGSTGSAPTTSTETAAPHTQQRVAPALDPDPAGGPCSGYGLDGVTLDMDRTTLEARLPLVAVPRENASIRGYEDRTVAFRAARPGRVDDVELGLSEPPESKVKYVLGRILVAPDDPWPAVLFERLGKPKSAKVGEWVWWDKSCDATLRLVRIEPLGDGDAQPYTLELRHTAKPAR